MKLVEVPQFTRSGNYFVDVGLGYVEDNLRQYVMEWGLDMNPVFQRAHVWDDTKRSKYIEYLLRGGTSSRVIYFNCPQWRTAGDPQMVLVDGKQRLDAVVKFLHDDVTVFGGMRLSDFTAQLDEHGKPMPPITRVTQGLKFNVNDLPTWAEVLQWYLDLNDGGVVHTPTELTRVRELLAETVQRDPPGYTGPKTTLQERLSPDRLDPKLLARFQELDKRDTERRGLLSEEQAKWDLVSKPKGARRKRK